MKELTVCGAIHPDYPDVKCIKVGYENIPCIFHSGILEHSDGFQEPITWDDEGNTVSNRNSTSLFDRELLARGYDYT